MSCFGFVSGIMIGLFPLVMAPISDYGALIGHSIKLALKSENWLGMSLRFFFNLGVSHSATAGY